MDPIRLKPPVLLALLVVSALIAGVASGATVSFLARDDAEPAAAASPSPPPRATPGDAAVVQAASRALPAVVTIINQGAVRLGEDGLAVESVSSGSGVIFDAAGFIVTNEHVVREPGTLSVVLNNGEQRPAVLVSHDAPFTDLAVLRIPEGGLSPLPLGDSAQLQLGQTVLAVGSALFEYRNSVSIGIVSGLERRYLRQGIYMEDLIQTDAAVNTGNSGGPLVTLDGRMVGLVSNVVRRIAGFENVQGISFAISSRTMAPILESIRTRGYHPRPYFGIEHIDLDVLTAFELGTLADRGALVEDVYADSPASSAGLERGDIVLAVGPYELGEDFTFLNALALLQPDQRVQVHALRGGDVQAFTVQLVPRE
jgi:S1-C subfamily serine protease